MTELVGSWTGDEEMREITEAIEKRPPREHRFVELSIDEQEGEEGLERGQQGPGKEAEAITTPRDTQNPEPPGSGAPKGIRPNTIPALLSEDDALTPTPTPGGVGRAAV